MTEEVWPSATVGPVSRADLVRYAGASGDFNPMHFDDDYARAAGYPGVFAMGMLPAGFLTSYAMTFVRPDQVRSIRVRFREQVWPGDVLELHGAIVESTAARCTARLTCDRHGGGTAVEATLTFVP